MEELRFSVLINEGAFFYEPWLYDAKTGKSWQTYDVPRHIRKLFAKELLADGELDQHEARMIIDWVIGRPR